MDAPAEKGEIRVELKVGTKKPEEMQHLMKK
jgi:hypothetical protein